MKKAGSFLSRASVLFVVFGALAVACGRSELLELGDTIGPDGGIIGPDGQVEDRRFPGDVILSEGATDITLPPPHCGDHTCDFGETCTTCPQDCGLCMSCGDGTCGEGETCTSCPQDCGLCAHCPDGVCDDGETCESCSPDCGPCKTCGDGMCEASAGENCFTCPADCGKCAGCGDGVCQTNETCASCPTDCGVCSFCGNGKCEEDETCSNCPADCGACKVVTCIGLVECSIGCLMPPNLTCLDSCLSGACPNALNAANLVIDCALAALGPGGKCMGGGGGSILSCIMSACPSQIASCLTISCTEM